MQIQQGMLVSLINSTGKDENIIKYVQLAKKEIHNAPFLPSVQRFRDYVFGDPLLRMQIQGALDQIPEAVASNDSPTARRPGMLHCSSLSNFFAILNAAVQTVPPFLASDYVGTPIGILLLDMMNTQLGLAVFSRSDVNLFLKPILDDYGLLLKSEKSLKYFHAGEGGLFSKEIMALIDYSQYVCDEKDPFLGFRSWNDWFTRDFKPGARPVCGEDDADVIVHNTQNFPVSQPVLNVQAEQKFWAKGGQYSLYDMLDAERQGLKETVDTYFVGGAVYQGYLNPWCYHQWHSPISGVVERSYRVQGAYFLQSPGLDLSQANNYDNSQPFMSCTATRHVFIINSGNPALGKVAVIEIGMVEISSCVPTVNEGDTVTKGQCIGRFELGGSSHVLVFERKAHLEFSPSIADRETMNGCVCSTRQPINSLLARVLP